VLLLYWEVRVTLTELFWLKGHHTMPKARVIFGWHMLEKEMLMSSIANAKRLLRFTYLLSASISALSSWKVGSSALSYRSPKTTFIAT
jgi:hypothetical protein